MKYFVRIEGMLKSKYFPILPAVIALIGVLTAPHRFTDQSYEIVQTGTKWISGSILCVESWSSHSPQTLYLGYLYGRFAHNTLTATVVELICVAALGALLISIVRQQQKMPMAARNAILALASTLLFVPRVWQVGLTDQKLGVLFLSAHICFYLLWKKSETTLWLFGNTSKNWRYILLSGIALSLLAHTSWVYLLLTAPTLIDFCTHKKWRQGQCASWGAFLIVPLLIELWVWLSHLSSHRLLSLYTSAQAIGIRASAHLDTSYPMILPVLLVLAVLGIALLYTVRGTHFRRSRSMWLWGLLSIALTVLWPAWPVAAALVLVPLIITCYSAEVQKIIQPSVVLGTACLVIILSLPLRLLNNRQAHLETAQAEVVIAYVEQRLVASNTVTFYGRGGGLYDVSGFENPTRYSDLSILAYDNDSVQIEPTYRGDAEALTPPFALVATSDELRAPATPRLDQYFAKHYEKVADLDGYQILKRK